MSFELSEITWCLGLGSSSPLQTLFQFKEGWSNETKSINRIWENKYCSSTAARALSQKAYEMVWALVILFSKGVTATTGVGSSTELTWDLSSKSSLIDMLLTVFHRNDFLLWLSMLFHPYPFCRDCKGIALGHLTWLFNKHANNMKTVYFSTALWMQGPANVRWFHNLRPCCKIRLFGTELHFRVTALVSVEDFLPFVLVNS